MYEDSTLDLKALRKVSALVTNMQQLQNVDRQKNLLILNN